ncbi:MAG: hypothetical protein WB992_17005, partial [Bryobacteraceae bacterium]
HVARSAARSGGLMFGSEILDVAIGLILLFLLMSLVCSSIKEALETVFKYRARDLERGIREIFGDINRTGFSVEFYKHPLINALFQGPYNRKNIKNLPSYIPARTFSLALMDMVGSGGSDVAGLRAAVTNLPQDSTIRGALLPLIDAAGNDIVRVRQNIEDWYNSSMDRVSGWYKRRTQKIIASIGLALALLVNADAVSIARYLNTNQTVRSVIVSRLAKSTPSSGPSTSDLTNPLGYLERQGGVPLGWLFVPEPGQNPVDFMSDWRRVPVSFGGWMLKIAGILFTAFAISLGAPFWFDVLNKFMVIRSTVKPDEKSPPEPSKA